MKFLCAKVKKDWLTVSHQIEKVENLGLSIKSPYIGISIKGEKPSEDEYNIVNKAVDSLFGNHKKAFPIRLIDL